MPPPKTKEEWEELNNKIDETFKAILPTNRSEPLEFTKEEVKESIKECEDMIKSWSKNLEEWKQVLNLLENK